MTKNDFDAAFKALTDNPPFPWQQALFARFVDGDIPASCNLPTGLGKTSVIAIWLLALAIAPTKMPRRLVYVVNRRTVVDQTTNEVEKILDRIATLPEHVRGLTVSTLRGQFADNREWSADPSRPAVICGTVDMIGSRLLFSGYGIGFKGKPLHAGFLGQDALLVHDEAHLEPAFQKLLVEIEKEQRDGERTGELPWKKLQVMELSATSRGSGKVFTLTTEERNPQTPSANTPLPLTIVWKRLASRKGLRFIGAARADIAKQIGRTALRHKASGNAVVIFVRTIEDVTTVRAILTEKKGGVGVSEDQVQILTGTLRGLERDRLATKDPIFLRLLLKVPSDGRTVYLICTSAGEVGIDISADHMVCDLSPYDSVAQRLGRVNRRGDGEAEIDVIYETDPDPKRKDDSFEKARWKTLAILQSLPKCSWIEDRQEASPHSLGRLMESLAENERDAAYTPQPVILAATDILFDAWALTTIRDRLPGRPPVEPFLHGISEWEPPEAHVAWREEVGLITGAMLSANKPEDLLDDYPLKPLELLREKASRVFDRLKKLKATPETPVWLLSDDDTVQVKTLGELRDGDKEALSYKTVLLPPSAGGLSDGMLAGDSAIANDVADEWSDEDGPLRKRVWQGDDEPAGMKLEREIEFSDPNDPDAEPTKVWLWFVRPKVTDSPNARANKRYSLQLHLEDAKKAATRFADGLKLAEPLRAAVILAAHFHDLGKNRALWQRSIGNPDLDNPLAKSGGKMRSRELSNYRHELGSLLDLQKQAEYDALSDDMKELVLHMIATHHGRGRPHFPAEEAFDPEANEQTVAELASAVPRRFARLQRKYGRWGLAYLESLVRAADILASKIADGGAQ